MRVLETGSLVLEPQTAAHAEEMFVVLGDPAIYEHENAPPASLEWLRTRFTRLETRLSADGREQWLNWVVRVPNVGIIGYVQATVRADGCAVIAYVLASAFWGRGFARRAVDAMMVELADHYGVRTFVAVLKRENARSVRLLERLGFVPGSAELRAVHGVEPDELLMQRAAGP